VAIDFQKTFCCVKNIVLLGSFSLWENFKTADFVAKLKPWPWIWIADFIRSGISFLQYFTK